MNAYAAVHQEVPDFSSSQIVELSCGDPLPESGTGNEKLLAQQSPGSRCHN